MFNRIITHVTSDDTFVLGR